MGTLTTTAQIYVGTYGKYNSGSIAGEWLDLSNYSDIAEFYEACKELHSDESDPEFMFQDWEGIPSKYISESFIDGDFWNVLPIINALESMNDSDLVDAHNTACQVLNHCDDEIYAFDEEFFNIFFADKPMEAARAASFGTINWSDDYIKFNGYANLESISDPSNEIDNDKIIEAYSNDPDSFRHLV